MRLADYITEFIYNLGVDTIFTLTGGGSIYLDDSLVTHPYMKHICVRNEATAPMMAEAYARLKGGFGAAYVTTGPGGTNAVSGLSEAYVDSAPIIIISGQVATKHTTRAYNIKGEKFRTFGTQELDIISVVKPLTKYAEMVTDSETIRYHLEKAIYLAKYRRPGPVWLDIPLDIQAAEIEPILLEGFDPNKEKLLSPNLQVPLSDVYRASAYMREASKPIIIAGQGIRISKAVLKFKHLVDTLRIPVIFSRLGQDLLSHNHPYVIGHGGTKGTKASSTIMKEADMILCLGSRLSVPFIGDNFDVFNPNAKVVMVDIDTMELKKSGVHITLPIQGDVGSFIEELLKLKNETSVLDYNKWLNYCIDIKNKEDIDLATIKSNPIDLYWFLYKLNQNSEDYHIFTSDAGSSYFVSGQMLKFEKGQREVTSGAFASMGVSIPLAIGSAIAYPDKQILAVTGDGSLELNIQELKTMSYNKLNIKLFVINNGGYASIRNTQDALFDSRYVGSNQLENDETLNLELVAKTFGLDYYKIDDWKSIDNDLKVITSTNKPMFIEVVCTSKQIIREKKNNWQT